MAEPPPLRMIQQQAKEFESKKAEREGEDKELIAEEKAGLIKLDASYVTEQNDLQADMHALRSHAKASADKTKFELEERHKRELEDLKAEHKQEIDSANAGKADNLKKLMETEEKRKIDLMKNQEEKKIAFKAEVIMRKDELIEKRQQEDEEVMKKWWKVLQDNSGAWASFDPVAQQQSGPSSTPTPKGNPNNSSKRQFGSPPPAMPVGQGGVWVESEGRNTEQREPQPNKRQKHTSVANTGAVRVLVALPHELPRKPTVQVVIPGLNSLSNMASSSPAQKTAQEQTPRSENNTALQGPTVVSQAPGSFNPPTGPRNFQKPRPAQSPQLPQHTQSIKGEKKAEKAQKPRVRSQTRSAAPLKVTPKPGSKETPHIPVIQYRPYIEMNPPAVKYFQLKFMATSTIFDPIRGASPSSNTHGLYLYYKSFTTCFHPENKGNDLSTSHPALIINLKAVDRIEYNAGKAMVIVHRFEELIVPGVKGRREEKEREKESLKGLKEVYIEFMSEALCLAFVNLCKDTYWHIILSKKGAEAGGIVDQFKYIGWSELKES